MPLQYAKHESLSLKKTPEFSEVWLHDTIAKDSSILGLGELDVLVREKAQFPGGRLDMLLADSENGIRYEVEIMLGATDPSHIVRCIEYWDIERRRYPAYDHIAVLVAEEVTTRFLNVMSLLAGSIPLIVIQLNALKVGGSIVLDFVKVLDQRQLREDDAVEADAEEVDRGTWEHRVGAEKLQICDRITSIANEVATPPLELKFKKRHLALSVPGQFANAMALFPKRSFVILRVPSNDAEEWVKRLKAVDLDAVVKYGDRVTVRLTTQGMKEQEQLLRELIHHGVKLYQE